LALAQRGYTVTAVDLSAAQIEVCRKTLIDEGFAHQVRLVVADARNLSAVTETEFDAVLLMGPLYHLIAEGDRKLALQEVFDRLRPNGLICSAFISRLGVLGDLIKKNPGWIENQAEVRSVLQKGHRPDDAPRGGFRGYLARSSEIAPLHEAIGFETIVVAGIEPVISADDESYNRLQGKQRQQWLDLFYEISAEPAIIGASRHLLYIGKKKP
jgi:S-adenosylmethionine-dependent methyltransferase